MPSIDPLPTSVKSPGKIPLVVLVGPTAVGKTSLSLELGQRLEAEIVSADSRLFYRSMDIGTAKPTPAERARLPHHLIDILDPDQTFSLAEFQARARQAIAAIHRRSRLPLLVGGTGQYVRAVTEGWQIPGVQANPDLRSALERWANEIGPNGLHARLRVLDPQAAAAIDYRNLRRTVRALEVILVTGRPFSSQRRRGDSLYDSLMVGLTRPRPELYARIDARIDAMFEAGLVAEVQSLLDRGYSPDLPAFSAIGYREALAYLLGQISLEDAIVQIKRSTRVFVRRQANWFKPDDPQIHWFEMEAETVEKIEALVSSWLADRPAPN